jgi:hypothetical protein
MPVEFEDVEFLDVAETGRHLGFCSDEPEQAARVARASAAGSAPNISQLMNNAPVRDTVPDVSSSAAEPVTAVEHMDDDDDDDDRPPGEVLSSDSQHVLAAALYSYYSTLDDEGDEIDWDQLSDEEFESKMEQLKVKERERITHRDIALGHCPATLQGPGISRV